MKSLLPTLAAAATGIFVGSTMVATRFVIDQTSPAALALLRYMIGFCCLLPPVLLSTRASLARRDLPPIALLGIIQFAAVMSLLNYALQYITSARAALIFASSPLQTMLLAWALGQERITWPKALGIMLTILGVGLAVGERALVAGAAEQSWLGDLAVLGSAFCAALCSVLYRPYLKRYPTLAVSAFAMLASVLCLAVLAAGEGFFSQPLRFTPEGWLAVGFIGVSSGIGYFLWLWALGHTAATRVTVFLAVSPATALVLGALLLAEPITVPALAGLAGVAGGLWLANWEGGSNLPSA